MQKTVTIFLLTLLVICVRCPQVKVLARDTYATLHEISRTKNKIAGFPQSEQSLKKMRDTSDRSGIRSHAWKLLEQLTKGGTPLWELKGWKNKCELDLSRLCLTPGQVEVINSASSQSTGNPGSGQALFTVFYNEDAAKWIKGNHLSEGEVLQMMIKNGNRDIEKKAPNTSIVIKEIWEAFNFGPAAYTHASIPVYNSDLKISTDHQLPDISSWPNITFKLDQNHLLVDSSCPKPTKGFPDGTPSIVGGEAALINCYYHKTYTHKCSDGVKLSSQNSGYNIFMNKPCAVVLVGVEIATKEMKNWTWSTYWLSNKSKDAGSEGLNPANLPITFRNFAMGTMLTPETVPLGEDENQTLAVFNPYLEGQRKKGTVSNCMSCHSRAAYTPNCKVGEPGCDVARNGIPAPEEATNPPKFCAAGTVDPVKNGCALKTSFLWSIATNQDTLSNQPFFRITRPAVLKR